MIISPSNYMYHGNKVKWDTYIYTHIHVARYNLASVMFYNIHVLDVLHSPLHHVALHPDASYILLYHENFFDGFAFLHSHSHPSVEMQQTLLYMYIYACVTISGKTQHIATSMKILFNCIYM